ncbi:SAMD13 isoform 9, partial [Pan troglodytes]
VMDVVNYFRTVGFEEQASAFQEQDKVTDRDKYLECTPIESWSGQIKGLLL